jgi:hypothetical protein
MAKTATADAKDKVKKKKKANAADPSLRAKAKTKAGKDQGAKPAKPAKAARGGKTSDALDGLARLVDHPLVADLLAAGAMAAVAAIAEHQLEKKGQGSAKMVKSVGKAAAAAMGRKLMGDLGSVAGAAADAAKKA